MPITFACATSHAPGITAWADAAPAPQKDRIYGAFDRLRADLDKSGTDTLIVLTSEHWTNFFLDHVGAFCIGRAERYAGPVEPWLQIARAEIKGDPELASELLETAYDNSVEPSFAYELEFDHGTMLPLHFLMPRMDRPIVPIFFNTLAVPQPTAKRCLEFGRVIGAVAKRSKRRIGLIATGGLSHDPGERNHGTIDSDFDHRFMAAMAEGNCEALSRYKRTDLAAAGAGAFELLSWIALSGALSGTQGGGKGDVVIYEAVKPWATGVGMMTFARGLAA
jgi:aromatic ring-opening dioxygenase catalytic subunit (LigB family)